MSSFTKQAKPATTFSKQTKPLPKGKFDIARFDRSTFDKGTDYTKQAKPATTFAKQAKP